MDGWEACGLQSGMLGSGSFVLLERLKRNKCTNTHTSVQCMEAAFRCRDGEMHASFLNSAQDGLFRGGG